MKSPVLYFILFLTAVLFSCQPEAKQELIIMEQDPHSFSKPSDAHVTHLNWKAKVDFITKTIEAVASWNIEPADGIRAIIFDTKELSIEKVTLNDSESADYTVGETDPLLGESLTVTIKPNTKTVTIFYKTNPGAEALQWLSPQQTAGKEHPFLFPKSQPILTRSRI